MKTPVLFSLSLITFAAGAYAEESAVEEEHRSIAIAATPGHAMVRFDAEAMDFDPHQLQVGESRAIVDDSGRTILVTRQVDGIEFQVDGRTIKMPLLDGAPAEYTSIGAVAHPLDVTVISDGAAEVADGMGAITILSGKPLDQATRDSIRSVLLSAGHDGEVRFIDRGHAVKMVHMNADTPAVQ